MNNQHNTMTDACSICYGSGYDVAGKPCSGGCRPLAAAPQPSTYAIACKRYSGESGDVPACRSDCQCQPSPEAAQPRKSRIDEIFDNYAATQPEASSDKAVVTDERILQMAQNANLGVIQKGLWIEFPAHRELVLKFARALLQSAAPAMPVAKEDQLVSALHKLTNLLSFGVDPRLDEALTCAKQAISSLSVSAQEGEKK